MSQRNSFCDITCVEKHKGFYNDADPERELNKILYEDFLVDKMMKTFHMKQRSSYYAGNVISLPCLCKKHLAIFHT